MYSEALILLVLILPCLLFLVLSVSSVLLSYKSCLVDQFVSHRRLLSCILQSKIYKIKFLNHMLSCAQYVMFHWWQERAAALAESRPLPPLNSSSDIRSLNLDDFRSAHEQVWFLLHIGGFVRANIEFLSDGFLKNWFCFFFT